MEPVFNRTDSFFLSYLDIISRILYDRSIGFKIVKKEQSIIVLELLIDDEGEYPFYIDEIRICRGLNHQSTTTLRRYLVHKKEHISISSYNKDFLVLSSRIFNSGLTPVISDFTFGTHIILQQSFCNKEIDTNPSSYSMYRTQFIGNFACFIKALNDYKTDIYTFVNNIRR